MGVQFHVFLTSILDGGKQLSFAS